MVGFDFTTAPRPQRCAGRSGITPGNAGFSTGWVRCENSGPLPGW